MSGRVRDVYARPCDRAGKLSVGNVSCSLSVMVSEVSLILKFIFSFSRLLKLDTFTGFVILCGLTWEEQGQEYCLVVTVVLLQRLVLPGDCSAHRHW